MGFEIEGHRYGLGASLFSDEKTLLETFGADSLEAKLNALSRDPKFFKKFITENN